MRTPSPLSFGFSVFSSALFCILFPSLHFIFTRQIISRAERAAVFYQGNTSDPVMFKRARVGFWQAGEFKQDFVHPPLLVIYWTVTCPWISVTLASFPLRADRDPNLPVLRKRMAVFYSTVVFPL